MQQMCNYFRQHFRDVERPADEVCAKERIAGHAVCAGADMMMTQTD